MSKKSNWLRKKKKKQYSKTRSSNQKNPERDSVHPELKKGARENVDSNMKLRIYNTKKKASDILIDFASPLIEKADNNEEIEKVLNFVIAAWNIGVLPSRHRENSIEEYILDMSLNDIEVDDLYKFVDKKKTLFKKYNYFLRNIHIEFYDDGKFNLSFDMKTMSQLVDMIKKISR